MEYPYDQVNHLSGVQSERISAGQSQLRAHSYQYDERGNRQIVVTDDFPKIGADRTFS